MAGETAPRPRRCAVIGAGVIGVCLAARLAEAGLEVTLLEQDQPGQATTRSSLAWVNANDKTPRDYHDLNHAGLRAWAALAPGLDGEAWYRPSGNLEWAADAPGREELTARVRRLTEWGYRARLLDAEAAMEREPSLRRPGLISPVAWFPEEAYLLTEPLVDRVAALARARGATLLTGESGRVTGLEMDGDPPDRAVRAVRTADGASIPADAVVCCAGRWTPEVAALAGANAPVPLVPWAEPGAEAPGLVVLAGPVTAAGPTRIVHAPDVHLRPDAGGLVHLEAPDAAVDLHTPEADLKGWAEELLRRARLVVGGLDGAGVADYRVCVRPMPADGRSIVGWLPGAHGAYLAVTHSGATLAAHVAGLITAELTGDAVPAELAPFRPDRFWCEEVPQPPDT